MRDVPIRSTKAIIIEYWDCGISDHTHFLECDARNCLKNRKTPPVKIAPEIVPVEPDAKRLPDVGYVRLAQIVGTKSIAGLIPMGRSTWLAGVKDGRFPKPVKLGGRMTAWKVEDIREYIRKVNCGEKWSDQ